MKRQSIIESQISPEESITSSILENSETTSTALQQDNNNKSYNSVPDSYIQNSENSDSLNNKVNKQLLKKL
jgi:hypothetical protein